MLKYKHCSYFEMVFSKYGVCDKLCYMKYSKDFLMDRIEKKRGANRIVQCAIL